MSAPPPVTSERRAIDLGSPLVQLEHVTVRAEDGHKVLDDVSLTLHEGEIVGLVFAHGTGKTTLLRVAAGFFPPHEGRVLYRGRDINELGFQEQIEFQSKTGFVFQSGGMLVNTKVFDNLALPLRYHGGLSEDEVERKVMTALESVGMSVAAHRFPFELTVARQKLCTLARALVREAEAIFFDNFVTGTEATVFHTLTRLVRNSRAKRGTAWMLVLESDASIFPIADRICVFEDGRLIESNTPRGLRESVDVRVSRLFHTVNLTDEESTMTHGPGASSPSRETPAPG